MVWLTGEEVMSRAVGLDDGGGDDEGERWRRGGQRAAPRHRTEAERKGDIVAT